MGKVAIVFPGQGSQFVGMGKELSEKYNEIMELYDEANRILGIDIKTICFEGPEDVLRETKNAQVAILIHSVACYKIRYQMPDVGSQMPEVGSQRSDVGSQRSDVGSQRSDVGGQSYPIVAAGHSVGEYSALVSAEALSFEDALHLVRFRGELMSKAGEKEPGTMAAVIGLPAGKIEEVLDKMDAEGPQIANYNAPLQTVISGSPESVKSASELLKSAGGSPRRAKVIPLKVSGAFHSRLMESAFTKFKLVLEKIKIETPKMPVVPNVTGKLTSSPDEIKFALEKQIVSPVRWVESVRNMIAYGVDTFIELGPGKVLTGLIKKIDSSVRVVSCEL